jgi:Caspase domain
MPLIFDKRSELGESPGCHALVVGVGSYPHLGTGLGSSIIGAKETLPGILSSASRSAHSVIDWLCTSYRNSAAPLASCRALISEPSQEYHFMPSISGITMECTVDDFLSDASEWRADLARNPESIAFFYFCGHSAEISREEPLILLQDFGSSRGPFLRGAVSTNNLFLGMSPWREQPDMARKQVFFIDSCSRYHPEGLSFFQKHNATPVFDAPPFGLSDDRTAVIFKGTGPDESTAYSTEGVSKFTSALLAGLSGGAARKGLNEELGWRVSVHSLAEAFPRLLEQASQGGGFGGAGIMGGGFAVDQIKRNFELIGILGKDWTLHELDAVPTVDFRVFAKGVDASFALNLANQSGKVVESFKVGGGKSHKITLPAGYYTISGSLFDSDGVSPLSQHILNLEPPYLNYHVPGSKQVI